MRPSFNALSALWAANGSAQSSAAASLARALFTPTLEELTVLTVVPASEHGVSSAPSAEAMKVAAPLAGMVRGEVQRGLPATVIAQVAMPGQVILMGAGSDRSGAEATARQVLSSTDSSPVLLARRPMRRDWLEVVVPYVTHDSFGTSLSFLRNLRPSVPVRVTLLGFVQPVSSLVAAGPMPVITRGQRALMYEHFDSHAHVLGAAGFATTSRVLGSGMMDGVNAVCAEWDADMVVLADVPSARRVSPSPIDTAMGLQVSVLVVR